MLEETAEPSERHGEQESGSQSGSQPQTPAAVDEKAASEQAASDEKARARNKAVRKHGKTPTGGVPPFSDHSGSL